MTIFNRPRRMRESSFSRTLMRENNISVSGTPAVKLNDYLKQSILLNKMVKRNE